MLLAPAVLFGASGAMDAYLIRGATIHTMAGRDIENGSVLIRDGKVVGVGKNLTAPKDTKVIEAKGLHVYPGMIDAGTEIGLVEVNAVRETEDMNEIGRFNPQLVALTAVNPSSEHIPVTRVNGITSVVTMPQGQLISGQVSLIHLDGWTTDEMGIKARAALHLRMPFIQIGGARRFVPDDEPGGGAVGGANYSEARRSFEKQMADLNDFFESARRYKLAKQAQAADFREDLKLDSMIPVIDGTEPILVTAIREREIRDAIAFADSQKVKIILCEAPEAYKVIKEIKAHDIPVILGPTFALPMDEDDPYDRAFTTAADLDKAGIRFAFASLSGGANLASRNLPYQAAQAVAFGLPHDDAIKALTRSAAEIWGVANQVGTIEEGKLADLIVTDGDPLESRTQVRNVFIRGKLIDMNNRQKELYEKYLNRP
jgi:imidazolonepropionase-like amidohydrolase